MKSGDKVWIFDEGRTAPNSDIIVQAELVSELSDGMWDCLSLHFFPDGLTKPNVYHTVKPAEEIFYVRDAALDWLAARYRKAVSKRSYEHQFQQENAKLIHETEWDEAHGYVRIPEPENG